MNNKPREGDLRQPCKQPQYEEGETRSNQQINRSGDQKKVIINKNTNSGSIDTQKRNMENKKKPQDPGRDKSNPKLRNEKNDIDKVDPDINEENSFSSDSSETESNHIKNQKCRQNKEGRDETKSDQEKDSSDRSEDKEYGEDWQPRLKTKKVRHSDRAMLNELNASIEKIKEVT